MEHSLHSHLPHREHLAAVPGHGAMRAGTICGIVTKPKGSTFHTTSAVSSCGWPARVAISRHSRLEIEDGGYVPLAPGSAARCVRAGNSDVCVRAAATRTRARGSARECCPLSHSGRGRRLRTPRARRALIPRPATRQRSARRAREHATAVGAMPRRGVARDVRGAVTRASVRLNAWVLPGIARVVARRRLARHVRLRATAVGAMPRRGSARSVRASATHA
jgi:hypothetical protein